MKKSLLVILTIFFGQCLVNGQGYWIKKADFPGITPNGVTGFSIGTKAYIFSYNLQNNFWEWNQYTDTWTQKADFPGDNNYVRTSTAGFSIGNKGYIGTGIAGYGWLLSDFWEWNQLTNSWNRKADIGGNPRAFGIGFSIDGKGYIATGLDFNTDAPQLWEYNPTTDSWTQKSDFAGGIRTGPIAFVIGNKAYIGTGSDTIDNHDLWEWDQITDTWTQKADFGGGKRAGA